MKTCKTCNKNKPLSQFPSRGVNGGVRPNCKPCFNEQQRAWREANPDKIKKSWRKASAKYVTPERRRTKTMRQYGMTNSDYDAILESQGGVCKICRQPSGRLAVDHCHTTDAVRGLLCRNCNLGLGNFKDDLDIIQSAVLYLEEQSRREVG